MVWGKKIEGFTVGIGSNEFLAKYMPRRGDVGPEEEDGNFIMDPRYFHDYADVQGFGGQTDYCRMVVPSGSDEKGKFFACALAGTEGLTTASYRTPTVAEGFRLGRDDYMRDIKDNGIDSYCRILKDTDGQFKALCNVGEVEKFRSTMIPDNEPPVKISELLDMYRGCTAWLRFFDDMVDYADNLHVSKAGGITIDEKEVNKTQGLYFNGESGYLRIGDNAPLEFGNYVLPRNTRGLMCWVKFTDFTNNAHIFDFGDGAGNNNVWLGIIGRGDLKAGSADLKSPLLCGTENTMPTNPSGAQYYEELSAQEMLGRDLTSCSGFTVVPKEPEPVRQLKLDKEESADAQTATMAYEIWDRDNRKMHVEIPQFFMKDVWTHVAIAALTDDPYRPDIGFYRNGKLVYVHSSGWLPQKNETSKNYIGRSNWIDASGPYANKSELFKGYMADFRMYNGILTAAVIEKSYKWALEKLDI